MLRDKNKDDTSFFYFFLKLAGCICGNDLENIIIFYLIK